VAISGTRRAEAPVILALDIGTSSARASLYDARGEEVGGSFARETYALQTTPDGGATLEAAELQERVERLVDTVLARGSRTAPIAAVAIASFWHSLVGVDAAGRAATPVFTWADARSRVVLPQLAREFDPTAVHARTGCPLHWSYWPAKLHWLAETAPELVRGVRHWLSFADYWRLQLFGVAASSLSMASATGLLRQASADWDPEVLAALPLLPAQLPPLVDPADPWTHLRPAYGRRWPALAGVPWLAPVGDGACSSLGCGALGPTRVALMAGTSGALRAVRPATPPAIPGLWCYRLDRRWSVQGGALNNAGALFAWLRRTLRLGRPAALEAALAAQPPDGHGLTILPFLLGERSPEWPADARAVFAGLTADTTPAEIARAALEAAAYGFAAIYERLQPTLPAEHTLIATGGGLIASPTWVRIITDALGHPATLSIVREASSRGAALLALERLGVIDRLENWPAPEGPRLQPDPARHAIYRAARARQARLYAALIENQAELQIWS
jgi:gluconokinase